MFHIIIARFSGAAAWFGILCRQSVAAAFFVCLSFAVLTEASAQSPEMTRNYQRGSSLYEAGMYEAATPYFERALVLSELEFGIDSSRTGFILKNLATVQSRQGKHSLAEPLYLRALAIFEQTFGPENGLVAELVNELSMTYVEQEKYIEAEPLLARVLENLENTFGTNDPRVAVAAYNYGYASEFLGDAQKARGLYARALQIWQSQKVPDGNSVAAAEARISGLGRSQGRKAPSLAPYVPRVLTGQEPQDGAPTGAIVLRDPATRPAPAVTVAAPSVDSPDNDKAWHVQLAAFRTREAAERELKRLQAAHGPLLSEAGNLAIQEAVLAEGVFYRVGTGPLPGKAPATSLCAALKEQQQGCIVVRR